MVKVIDEPLDAEELVARVRGLLRTDPELPMDARDVMSAGPANPRIHNMRVALGALAAPSVVVGGGRARALAGTFLKRVVRRLTAWYIEPRWTAQAMFNEQIMSVAVDHDRFEARVTRAETDLASHTAAVSEHAQDLDERLRALADEIEDLRRRLFSPPQIDYVRFEEAFRGTSDELRTAQAKYAERFTNNGASGPVVDIGCGRGEMLELLTEAGVVAVGVETDPGMLAVCRAKGLDVAGADGLAWLSEQPDDSLGGIFMAQVIEHLPIHDLVRLVELAAQKLRPGGLLIAETIDPRSLYATANFFWADLSHVRPVHPATLAFLVEQVGFSSCEVVRLSRHDLADAMESAPQPAGGDHDLSDGTPPDVRAQLEAATNDASDVIGMEGGVDDETAKDEGRTEEEPTPQEHADEASGQLLAAVQGLLDVVYGFQDYALVATR
jgi:SAM-dependent methyltransferase